MFDDFDDFGRMEMAMAPMAMDADMAMDDMAMADGAGGGM